MSKFKSEKICVHEGFCQTLQCYIRFCKCNLTAHYVNPFAVLFFFGSWCRCQRFVSILDSMGRFATTGQNLYVHVDTEKLPSSLPESKSCFHRLSLSPRQTEYAAFKALLVKALKYGSRGYTSL